VATREWIVCPNNGGAIVGVTNFKEGMLMDSGELALQVRTGSVPSQDQRLYFSRLE